MSNINQAMQFKQQEPKQKFIAKRPFTPQEDQILIKFFMANGPHNWSSLANVLQSRTPKQCRERWHNHLDPKINKGPWTHQEDIILAQKHSELGNKWADIAKFLPGRTDTLVKNRWNTSVKARVNELLYNKPMCKVQTNDDSFNNWLTSLTLPKKFDISFLSIPPLMQKTSVQVF
ncbi:Myb-like DNA-binding domain containing protein [Trichomonas vaginalis G3]|uniref:Myb-like DNA-binding domain containing protein n=1 Tax=Trichomonas vaginalis (strain ATCC PRA-98 / G3) TaxID=412133 RepID=A2DKD8_TRIV3|nr:RNA polymerase II transcription regulator recruiting protein [Trichomonas vaginalis G3]EAY19115.1 Myb-like DNA-binding domain containing protein [Trichomonas vaginalis G3]KAI5490413.1 RNA polymerase II transcription regulator recruiting protein [Trichomonas vaginalis G3]|eukprot:XP_001580101.1 Myb-like DNA-binding domain containing protein [Trichomonas vaginalis G3]